jgi:hypothetical protein
MNQIALAGEQGHCHGGDRLDGQNLCLLMLLLKENCNGVQGTLQNHLYIFT